MARHLRRFACPSGKWTYDKEKYALRALRFQREKGVIKKGRPYRCESCSGWHLTSQIKMEKR